MVLFGFGVLGGAQPESPDAKEARVHMGTGFDTPTEGIYPFSFDSTSSPGTGPRPLAFYPSGETVHLIGELSGTITAYDYDPEGGRLHAEQTVSTVPDDFGGAAASADFHVHPSGNFLYASNQGDANDLVVYRIDADTGGQTCTGQSVDVPASAKISFVPRPNGAAPSTER